MTANGPPDTGRADQTLRFLGPYEERGNARQPGERTSSKAGRVVAGDAAEALRKEGTADGGEREEALR
ncbi:hypothetical protein ACIHCM_10550 [Streptomyces sp. NPDC052023]|uniref:hypothetical protein n=1 Tax=Streptomyces sp. NPDC052023 TaxID=3365681 RepID=UPI0037D78962